MTTLLDLQKKLVPDALELMANRYRILQSVQVLQPIGRRSLSAQLGVTERVLRSEVTFLHQQGLIQMSSGGMRLSSEGEDILSQLDHVMKDISNLRELEKSLSRVLGINKVIVVQGDSDQTPWVKRELGKVSATIVRKKVKEDSVIAITGGSTLADIAEMMQPIKNGHNLMFVSGRGGLGEKVEYQANTICAKMAEKAQGKYRLLHVPDMISEESYIPLIEEPSVKEVLQLLHRSSMIIHGIGEAKMMANRRKSNPSLLEKIASERAVAEAFGYYFDGEGRVVHKVTTIGLQYEDLFGDKTVIAVAGGQSKAKAIKAYFKQGPDSILITDEGAAKEILKNFKEDV